MEEAKTSANLAPKPTGGSGVEHFSLASKSMRKSYFTRNDNFKV
jgi:hypothetical protein